MPRSRLVMRMIHTLEAYGVLAQIDTTGAYPAKLEIDGETILKPSPDGTSSHGGSVVMVPYSGRVRKGKYAFEGREYSLPINDNLGNSIHGLVRNSQFSIVKEMNGEVVMRTTIAEESYPSTLDLEMKYKATPHKFLTSFRVTNSGPRNAPLLVGSHPYFIVSRDWKLQFSRPLFELEAEELFFPTGVVRKAKQEYSNEPSAFDEHLFYKGGGIISLVRDRITVEIARNNMDYLTIYTGEFTEGKSIAIEPQSGIPDAFNNGIGLKTIRPGQWMNFWFTIQVLRR